MFFLSRVIVLKTIRYDDKQKLVYCFSEDFGKKGFVTTHWRGNESNLYSTLSGHVFTLSKSNKRKLSRVLKSDYCFGFENCHPSIQNEMFFICEVIYNVLGDHNPDKRLFCFLWEKLSYNCRKSKSKKNKLLLQTIFYELSKHLGFLPDIMSGKGKVFYLKEGVWVSKEYVGETLSKKESLLLNKFLGIDFAANNNEFSRIERMKLIDIWIRYFSIHCGQWKALKSYEVIQSVYD